MKMRIKKIKHLKVIAEAIAIMPFILGTILFIVFLFLILYVLIKKLLVDPSNTTISILLSSVIELFIISGLSAIPKFRKKLFVLYALIKKKIYNLVDNISISNWTKSKFINKFNSENLLAYNSQSLSIKTFIDCLLKNNQSLFCVTGDGDSGKTSTVLLLFERCVNSKEFYELFNNKTIYISKSYSEEQISKFISNYLLEKYTNYYIFIDDIGELSLISQIRLWNEIILPKVKNETCNAKAITIITNQNNSLIRAKIENEGNNKYVLLEIRKDFLKVDTLLPKTKIFCQKHQINDCFIENWVNMILLNDNSNGILDDLLNKKPSAIQVLFICIVVASKYSKVSSVKLIKKLYKSLGYNIVCFYKNLKKLINLNIVMYFPFLKKHIYIDQTVLHFFSSYYQKNKLYASVISYFCNENVIDNDAEKWLISCENMILSNKAKSTQNSELFSKAFNIGNYNFLLDELKKIISLKKSTEKFFLKELGYLNEKVGNREEAIKYLELYICSTTDKFEKYQSYLLLFEIKHHNDQSLAEIRKIANSQNRYLSLQAAYWIEHINIEKGIFNYDKLTDIVSKYMKITTKDSINYYHILRRMFSDLSRVYYLMGKIDCSRFLAFKEKLINSDLRVNHAEFDDYYGLLTRAQYIHYDVIFQKGFYNALIHNCDDIYMEIPGTNRLIDLALDEYKKCERNFKGYGDKAWMTISIRKNELMMCTNVELIKIIKELYEIRDVFISNKNELHLAFVDCVLCKAEFLNYYLYHIDLEEEKTIKKCKFLIKEAKTLYEKFENSFGLYRLDFISIFIEFFVDIQHYSPDEAINKFKSSLKKMKKEEYFREYEMIEYILDMKKIRIDLIKRFFMYYPIILQ